MAVVRDVVVCPKCGEVYLREVDCKTGKVTKLTMCECDRRILALERIIVKLVTSQKLNKKEERIVKSLLR